MKRKRSLLVLLSILVVVVVCAAVFLPGVSPNANTERATVTDISTATQIPTGTVTSTATNTATPTQLPTATQTPTPTKAPVMQQLLKEAEEKEMFVVVLFNPPNDGINTTYTDVDLYFQEVEEIEGITIEDVAQQFPDIMERVVAESIYPPEDYFRVLLVGDFYCMVDFWCTYPPEYYYNDVYQGVDLGHLYVQVKYGSYAIHWQPAENIFCIAGTVENFCSERR